MLFQIGGQLSCGSRIQVSVPFNKAWVCAGATSVCPPRQRGRQAMRSSILAAATLAGADPRSKAINVFFVSGVVSLGHKPPFVFLAPLSFRQLHDLLNADSANHPDVDSSSAVLGLGLSVGPLLHSCKIPSLQVIAEKLHSKSTCSCITLRGGHEGQQFRCDERWSSGCHGPGHHAIVKLIHNSSEAWSDRTSLS
jgi:hypothetical protein